MPPFMSGGEMIQSVELEKTSFNALPWKFEAGTPAIVECVGLGASIDYLEAIGMDAVAAHEAEITEYAYERLSAVEGLTILGPPVAERGGVVSFTFEPAHPHDVAQIVDRRGVCVRAGPSLHPAADEALRRAGDHARQLLPLHGARGDRPPLRRARGRARAVRMMDENFYREQILDHYKSPRNRGELDPHDATAEGQNPLCGDEITVDLRLTDDQRIEAVRFRGQGCAISQAAMSMLSEEIEGKPAVEVAALGREDVVDLLGIQLSPVRLKCALLGLGVVKVALNSSVGTPLPEGFEGLDEVTWT